MKIYQMSGHGDPPKKPPATPTPDDSAKKVPADEEKS